MKRITEALNQVFIVVSLLYFTSTLNFVGGVSSADNPALRDSVEDNSTILSLMQYGILGITFLLTCIRHKRIAYLASRRKFLWVLVGLAILSFLWSPVPDITLRKAIVFFGLILFGLNVAACYTLEEQLLLLAITMGLIILINIVFTLALPWAAIESGEHQGAWRGVYIQKNLFARMMVMSTMTFLLAALDNGKRHRILWVGLGFSILLVLLSTSKSALLILLILLTLLPLFRTLRSNYSIILPSLILILLIIGSAAIFVVGNAENIVRFLGRDLTLTGRTGIWAVVISKIALHPWLGYGYKGFWHGMEGDSADVWYEAFFMAPHSHNGFLDITVELGLIGLSFFLLTYIKNCLRAITWLRLNPKSAGLYPITYLTFIFLYNLTENSLTDPNYFIWVMYSMITTSVLTQPISVSSHN